MKTLKLLAAAAALTVAGSMAQASCTMPANANAFANQLAQGVNANRQANGLRGLRFSNQLSQAAMRHACDMQRNGFFAHRGSDGSDSHQRVLQVGYRTCLTAENLASGFPQPTTVVSGWMNSPGHRRNMLAGNATEFGIGVVEGPLGGPIAVLVVARPCGA